MGHTLLPDPASMHHSVHPHIRGAYRLVLPSTPARGGSSTHTWGIRLEEDPPGQGPRFIPTYVGHTRPAVCRSLSASVHPHIRGAYDCTHTGLNHRRRFIPTYVGHTATALTIPVDTAVHPHIRGAYSTLHPLASLHPGSSPHTWGIHWTAVRKMAGFSHFSYDFIRKSYFVQGLVFFGVIGAEASPTHRRGRSQCLPGAHGGSVRNL